MVQVYAVVYAQTGEFLIGTKNINAYFFSPNAIFPKGKAVNGAGKWCLPGGKMERGDDNATSAALREFVEETGIAIELEDIEHTSVMLWERKYYGAYFRLPLDKIRELQSNAAVAIANGNQIAAAVRTSTIRSYGQIKDWAQSAGRTPYPVDNELATLEIWNLYEPVVWETIEGWNTPSSGLDWYYEVLSCLKNTVIGNTSNANAR